MCFIYLFILHTIVACRQKKKSIYSKVVKMSIEINYKK